MIGTFDGNRNDFIALLKKNPGLIIAKFGAEWCKPCGLIKNTVENNFNEMPDNVLCLDIDVDEAFDLFAFMKSKKMMKGIPTILCYKKGNNSFASDDSISGADENEVQQFFDRCKKYVNI